MDAEKIYEELLQRDKRISDCEKCIAMLKERMGGYSKENEFCKETIGDKFKKVDGVMEELAKSVADLNKTTMLLREDAIRVKAARESMMWLSWKFWIVLLGAIGAASTITKML